MSYLETINQSVSFLREFYKKQNRNLTIITEGQSFDGFYYKTIVIEGEKPPPVPNLKKAYSITYTADIEINKIKSLKIQGTNEFIDSIYRQVLSMKEIFGFKVKPLQIITETSGFWEQTFYLSVIEE